MATTNRAKAKAAIKWIDTLITGRLNDKKLKQGKGQLGDAEMGYCCLGVGCELLKLEFAAMDGVSSEFTDTVGLISDEGSFQSHTLKYYGGNALTEINDDSTAGFKRIGLFMKSHPFQMFVEPVAKLIAKHYGVPKPD